MAQLEAISKDAIDTGCLARRVPAEHTTSRAEILNSIV
jgi:hypothetical protein